MNLSHEDALLRAYLQICIHKTMSYMGGQAEVTGKKKLGQKAQSELEFKMRTHG